MVQEYKCIVERRELPPLSKRPPIGMARSGKWRVGIENAFLEGTPLGMA